MRSGVSSDPPNSYSLGSLYVRTGSPLESHLFFYPVSQAENQAKPRDCCPCFWLKTGTPTSLKTAPIPHQLPGVAEDRIQPLFSHFPSPPPKQAPRGRPPNFVDPFDFYSGRSDGTGETAASPVPCPPRRALTIMTRRRFVGPFRPKVIRRQVHHESQQTRKIPASPVARERRESLKSPLIFTSFHWSNLRFKAN